MSSVHGLAMLADVSDRRPPATASPTGSANTVVLALVVALRDLEPVPAFGPAVQDGPRGQPLWSVGGDHPPAAPHEPLDLREWLAAPLNDVEGADPDPVEPDPWGTIG